jgi:hypothetical protein
MEPQNRLGFRIYYQNGALTGMSLADWDAMPDNGIVAVVEVFEKGIGRTQDRYTIQVHADQDYYWMIPEKIEYVIKNVIHVKDAFEIDAGSAPMIPKTAHVKEGLQIPQADFERIMNIAQIPPTYGTFP